MNSSSCFVVEAMSAHRLAQSSPSAALAFAALDAAAVAPAARRASASPEAPPAMPGDVEQTKYLRRDQSGKWAEFTGTVF